MSYRVSEKLHPTFSAKYLTYSEIFSELGASLSTPSGDGYVWRVSLGDRSTVFLSDSFPMNSSPASNIAKDKLATYQILSEAHLRIPKGIAFFGDSHTGKSTQMEPRFLLSSLEQGVLDQFQPQEIEEGLIVKPGTESGGIGVRLCFGMNEVLKQAKTALELSHFGIVQEFVPGEEFRVAILDDQILVAYKKRNPVIRGDGRSALGTLLIRYCETIDGSDMSELGVQKLSQLAGSGDFLPEQILQDGQEIELMLETRNLSRGAWPELIGEPPENILRTALDAHRALGLTYSGVDIKLPAPADKPFVLEVNANPGFAFLQRHHPQIAGDIQRRIAVRIVNNLR